LATPLLRILLLLICTLTLTVNINSSEVPTPLDLAASTECWVNYFDNTENASWIFTGATPYLHNDTTSYIMSFGTGNCSWFQFQDTNLTTLQNVYLIIEWKTSQIKSAEEVKLYLDNGTSEVDLGSFNLILEYRWTKINVTNTLNTISKVNNAKLKIASLYAGLYIVMVRRAYLKIFNGPVPLQTGTVPYSKAGGKVALSVKWGDPDGLSSYVLSHNASGAWITQNITGVLEGTTAWSNYTITLQNDTASVLAYKFWANDTNNNWEKTEVLYVYPVKNFSPDLLQYVEDVGGSPIAHSYGRKDFYDNVTGIFWKFYSDGTNIKYTASEDGQVWGSSQTVRSAEGGFQFYVHNFNGTIYYVFNSEKTGGHIYYRRGLLNANRTITWVTSEQIAVDAGASQRFYACSIVTDTDGYPYIVYGNRTNPNSKTLSLVKSDYNNGTWRTTSGFPKQINDKPDSDLVSGVALRLPSNGIYVIYCSAGNQEPPRGRLWSGSTLGPLENASDYTMSSNYLFSAVSDSYGNVHIVYRRTSSKVDYSFRNYTTGNWEVKDELVTLHLTSEALGNTAYSWPVIGWNPDSEKIYVHWWTLEDKSAWLKMRDSTSWELRRRIIRLNDDFTLIDGDVIIEQSYQNRILINFVVQNIVDGGKELWAYLYTNKPPVAIFSESAEVVYTGEIIAFNATGSYDLDGTIVNYFWDFGDGTNATGVTVEHAYVDNGAYTVTLTVTDDDGATANATSVKTVLNRAPVALFTESAEIVYPTEIIYFNASQSYDPDGYIVSYYWDFGDGANATGITVEHSYAENGTYTVTLTVTDDDGATDNVTATKTVLRRDVAVLAVMSSKTVVGTGFNVTISIVVENQGDFTETFNVTVYANASFVALKAVTLSSGNSTALTFTWNTAGWVKGNYTVSALADMVLGETDIGDNNFTDGYVFVTIPGDVDGDRDVDIFDIVYISNIYGVSMSDSRYNANCDIDGDGDIDIYDVVIAAGNYRESW